MAVVRSLGVFYADDGIIRSWYPEWLQGALSVLIGLFSRVRLMVNVAKSNNMTFQLWEINTGMS